MHRNLIIVAAILSASVSLAPAQTTITVGQGGGYDYATIQAAIDAATAGDTVIVHHGIYVENIRFRGIDIVLRSTDPTDTATVAATIIDGNSSGSVVTFEGTESSSCLLAGFTITNGNADRGGGSRGNDTHATIQNNTITSNTAHYSGGGLAFCRGVIQDNKISGNAATYIGGGLYQCDGTIQNNTINGNSANEGGGVVYCDAAIQNNTITGNAAKYRGGGLFGCYGTIQNNTISGNTATREGGGLSDCRGTIRNCIIWRNRALERDQLDKCSTPSYSCIHNWIGGGVANIAADPQLVGEASSDFHLRPGSPCIDAGANGYWWFWPQRDLDGNCRLAGTRVDMGAYEYGALPDTDGDLLADVDEATGGTDSQIADTDGDSLQDGLEVLRGSDPLVITQPGILHVPQGIAGIQEAILASLDGDEIIVSPGVYPGHLQFKGANIVLRSEAPENPATVASTVLDGQSCGRVVTFAGTETSGCLLAGFTIIRGSAEDGGGIHGRGTHATIQNNRISDNTATGSSWRRGGGGLYRCNGTIRNNTVSGNSAEYDGGGLYLCAGTIHNNVVSGNSAKHDGGGLFRCHGTVQNNTITSNSAEHHGGGFAHCDGTIRSNAITSNFAGFRGGGLTLCAGQIEKNAISSNSAEYDGGGLSQCDGAIQNNTISNNSAGNGGGGLVLCRGTIRNNIISGNSAAQGSGLNGCRGTIQNNTISGNTATGVSWQSGGGGLYGCDGTIRNCIIWQNSAPEGGQIDDCSTPSYSCIEDWQRGGSGNISVDPLFIDSRYRLSPISPAVDAGDPDPAFSDACLPPGLGSVRNDMGAYGGPQNCGWPVRPDLTGVLLGVAPNVIVGNHTVHLSGSVVNQGYRPSTHPVWVEFWAIGKQTAWSGYLCDSINLGPLAVGEAFDLATIVPPRVARDNIPAGAFAVEMRIDTVLNEVAEWDETNNIARWHQVIILPDRPNLTVRDFDFAPQVVDPDGGTSITFTGSIVNNGSQATSDTIWVEICVWPELPIQSRQMLLCDPVALTGGIAASGSMPFPSTPLPSLALDPGAYYVGIFVDPLDAISEQWEDDNLTWVAYKKLYVGSHPTATAAWRHYP